MCRAEVIYPAERDSSSPLISVESLLPSGIPTPWALGMSAFRGWFPTARSLVYLRIAEEVANSVARLTSGLPGSALTGQDLHLLDDEPNFKEVAPPFFPSD